MLRGDESYAGARSWYHFEKVLRELTGMPHILPTHQGRASERILFELVGGPGKDSFNAGAGNCYNGGQPEALYETFVNQLARLPDSTHVYPGHEYLARNLEFTLDREPGNADAEALLGEARHHDPAAATVTTLGREKRINTFFRLQNPTVIARLRAAFPDIGEQPDARTVFVRLRELRNRW